MSTASIHLDAHLPARRAITEESHARDFGGNDDAMPPAEYLLETNIPAMPAEIAAQAAPSPAGSTDLQDLSERMQLLIRIAGSAAAIAKRCGFSESAVRNWCHGRTDISRERCTIIARALGVSLRWLVTGEGSMRDEDDSAFHAPMPQAAPHPPSDPGDYAGTHASTVDPGLLAAAFRVLQSYIVLVGGSLNPLQRADVVAQIYQALARTGGTHQADRLVAFHATLGGYFCSRKSLIG